MLDLKINLPENEFHCMLHFFSDYNRGGIMKLFDNGEKLLLKVPSAKDLQLIAQWSNDGKLEERTCRPVVNGRRQPSSNHTETFVIYLKTTQEPVGRIQFFDFNPRNRSAEFGYIVNPSFRGRGIGTKMLELGISSIFTQTDLNKLYCQTAEFNEASVKMLKKLGFHLDGTLREHHELDGKLYSDYIFSILRKEWEKTVLSAV
jgi:RimJ/RimL family protein N-acetyltransferase